jgi:hypothetical protein
VCADQSLSKCIARRRFIARMPTMCRGKLHCVRTGLRFGCHRVGLSAVDCAGLSDIANRLRSERRRASQSSRHRST